MSKKPYESLRTQRLRLHVAFGDLLESFCRPLGGVKVSIRARHAQNRHLLTESIAMDAEIAQRREVTQ